MSRVYDNWERLVEAVLKREKLRELALCESFSSSSADFSFDSSVGDVSAPSSLGILSYREPRPIEFKEIKKATRNFQLPHMHEVGAFDRHCCQEVESRRLSRVSRVEVLQKELDYLSELRHPNLVKFVAYCDEEDNKYLVYEFMSKGSLDNHLFTSWYGSLSWATRIKVAIDVAGGLSFLHDLEKPVIYLDVMCSHILLDGEFNAKLSNLGLARDGPTRVGTYAYAAPEYVATAPTKPRKRRKKKADFIELHGVEVTKEDMIRKELSRNAFNRQWDRVVEIYRQYDPVAHQTKITENGDTAICFAITEDKDDMVKELIDAIVSRGNSAALGMPNINGDTALHLAAFRGNATICHYIAEEDPELIGRRNKLSETPFFQAVHYGKKEAFHRLHRFCSTEKGQIYGRRGDGETILHTAISRQYYDMAFEIIHHYPKLAYSVNEKGFSPLHVLANMPYAFRSGTHIQRWLDRIIYYCVCVDELERELSYELASEKHQTWVDCIPYRIAGQRPSVPKPHHDGAKRMFKMMLKPVGSCLKYASKAVLWIICLGNEPQIRKMRKTKEMNVWSRQILRALAYKLVLYSYEDNGRNPDTSTKNISPEGWSTPPAVDNSSQQNQKNEGKHSQGTIVEDN